MLNQHWQTEDVLIGQPITSLYVNEALLSANGSTAFPDMWCADRSPLLLEDKHVLNRRWYHTHALLASPIQRHFLNRDFTSKSIALFVPTDPKPLIG